MKSTRPLAGRLELAATSVAATVSMSTSALAGCTAPPSLREHATCSVVLAPSGETSATPEKVTMPATGTALTGPSSTCALLAAATA